MRIRKIILIALLLSSLLISCSKTEDFAPKSPEQDSAALNHRGAPQSSVSVTTTTVAQRMIIKNATLTIEHDAPEATVAKALAIVESAGGFVVTNNVQQYGESMHASIKLRMPSDKFEDVLGQLRELGVVRSESVEGQDVTEEFTDVQAQLRNQRALESRFIELLGQAATVTETIEVERELARVRTEVERLEGRSKFLTDQVALSTIDLEVRPKSTFSGTSIGDEVADAFGDSGEIIAVVIGALIRLAAGFLPIAFLLTMLIVTLRALSRRRKKQP